MWRRGAVSSAEVGPVAAAKNPMRESQRHFRERFIFQSNEKICRWQGREDP